jgi:sRNA-binding protein
MENSASNPTAEKTATGNVNSTAKVENEKAVEVAKLLEAAKKQASESAKKSSVKIPSAKKPTTKKSTAKTSKKKDKPSMASELDKIILAGGPFEEMIKAAEKRSKELGGSVKYSVGVIKAHIRYREVKNPKYLGNLKLTDKGLFEKTPRVKKTA